MTLADLEILVEFHYWATKRILDAVEPLTPDQFTKDLRNSFPSVRDGGRGTDTSRRCGQSSSGSAR